ncbi:MAG: ATP-binding cassette domain-containing protein [Acidobacteria bacterium]|nr:ATP-binding cassette domain-containing protein [Acidobacteriota bacterium]
MLSVKIKKRLTGLADHGFTLDVEFDVPVGITILFGASGSGKSITLKSIAGIVRPDSGLISVGGRVLFDSERGINLPIRERGAGYVFQSLALLPHLSALGNVEFAIKTLPRRERRERALALMQSFRIEHTASRRPREISGGEAQRVALARALAGRPRLLLLDEPLSALDDAIKLEIIADLKKINRDLRLPVVYVTEEPRSTSARNILRGRIAEVEERGDRVLVHVSCSGVGWVVSVTRQAARELRLSKGRDVWLAIKTYSCHLLDR